MVLKKKLDHRFNGFQVPTIPRGPRSSRRRAPNEKKSEDTQLCAFELLASLAGKLLQESESSSVSSNASIKEEIKQEQLTKDECFGHGSSEESAFASEICSADIDQKFPNPASERSQSKFDFVQKSSGDDVKSVHCDTKPALQNYPTKAEKDWPITGASCNAHVGNGIGEFKTCDRLEPASLTTAKLVDRDDDENFATFDKSSVNAKAFRPLTHVGDHRIRKLLTSKYWKMAPKLRDCEGFRFDRGGKTRKNSYQHDRCHYETLNKRRKLFDRSAVILSEGGFSSESATNSPEKPKKGDTCISNNGMFHGATVVSPSIIRRQSSYQSKDSHVKLSIKSFKIPELYIEVPETATVGSLKRTVMDAITAILGGEFCIGVNLEGEKIRDDNITLSQTGLSCKDNLDTLGFTLEPNTTQISPLTGSGEVCHSLSCVTPEPLTKSPGTPVLDSGGISNALPELSPPFGISANTVKSSHELVAFDADSLPNNTTPDSRALVVAALPVSVAALAIVPATPKSSRKCSDLVQRRTRRPFSVTEVEALVHAVEDLGTGRWRDVKLCAFEDADHRTYVDLKDKWKTLVHTATISPQQRRGKPVPQELLDRVLAAHSYWSQHQARQHGKFQGASTQAKIGGESDNNTCS